MLKSIANIRASVRKKAHCDVQPMDEVIEFPKSEAQLAAERMRAVERQIHRYVPPGVRRSIRCPYCNALNFHEPGGLFCCDTLRHAVVTVLVADRALAAAEAGEKQIVH